ncbi:hypothetical protein AVDCRST_MAG82-1452, partial [uncultured Rubrobacteraceae bacterium]
GPPKPYPSGRRSSGSRSTRRVLPEKLRRPPEPGGHQGPRAGPGAQARRPFPSRRRPPATRLPGRSRPRLRRPGDPRRLQPLKALGRRRATRDGGRAPGRRGHARAHDPRGSQDLGPGGDARREHAQGRAGRPLAGGPRRTPDRGAPKRPDAGL